MEEKDLNKLLEDNKKLRESLEKFRKKQKELAKKLEEAQKERKRAKNALIQKYNNKIISDLYIKDVYLSFISDLNNLK